MGTGRSLGKCQAGKEQGGEGREKQNQNSLHGGCFNGSVRHWNSLLTLQCLSREKWTVQAIIRTIPKSFRQLECAHQRSHVWLIQPNGTEAFDHDRFEGRISRLNLLEPSARKKKEASAPCHLIRLSFIAPFDIHSFFECFTSREFHNLLGRDLKDLSVN
jgi:hypothetical protein